MYYLHFEVYLWLLAGELLSSATNFRGKSHAALKFIKIKMQHVGSADSLRQIGNIEISKD
jgi:hypothetical protein